MDEPKQVNADELPPEVAAAIQKISIVLKSTVNVPASVVLQVSPDEIYHASILPLEPSPAMFAYCEETAPVVSLAIAKLTNDVCPQFVALVNPDIDESLN